MSRYICVDDAKRIINEEFDGVCVYDVGQSEVINDFERIIDMCPSSDVKPVVHGEWIYDHYIWICSECHKNPTMGMGYVQGERNLYDFCPNCGAKMQEDAE